MPDYRGGMSLGERLARWRMNRKLARGRCDWCGAVLPDTGPLDPYYRGCSQQCVNQLWADGTG